MQRKWNYRRLYYIHATEVELSSIVLYTCNGSGTIVDRCLSRYEMSHFDLYCLLGEAGDILIHRSTHKDYFNSLNYEEDEDYRRLIDLPVAIDVMVAYGGLLLLVTREGQLMLVTNNYPEGVILQSESLPPLRKIYNSRPFSVLDINNTFRFVDLPNVILENIPRFAPNPDYTISYSEYGWRNKDNIDDYTINDVRWIIYQNNDFDIIDGMIIKNSGGLTRAYIRNSVRYKSMGNANAELIGNCFSYYKNGIRFASNGATEFEISDQAVDIIIMTSKYYIIDRSGSLEIKSYRGNYTKKPTFIPTRLLISSITRNVCVEDSEGNLYKMEEVMSSTTPYESLDLPVILSGFKRRGMRIKSGRYGAVL